MTHDHAVHQHRRGETDRRWLLAAFSVIVAFMVGEIVVGLVVGSLALLSDAGHMLTDAAALGLAVVVSKVAQRPARGAFTYGFARVDALSAQANGITLLLLAVWFTVEAIRRLISPMHVHGLPVFVVALIGIVVNLAAVLLAGRADTASLNVRGALAHVMNDLWAFVATAVAGVVIMISGWYRADAVASLVIAALMVYSGVLLLSASGRVFLEAAPHGLDPDVVGRAMAAVPGVIEVHDLHVWDLGANEPALSAHLVVSADFDCHEVANGVRMVLTQSHRIQHATLQADHWHGDQAIPADQADNCGDSHGPGYVADTSMTSGEPSR